ncbi:MAG: TonB-dependent receptor [Bacteroidales bacterium]|nr:TonB-dependent receptor [Bacteroidales bacterium]
MKGLVSAQWQAAFYDRTGTYTENNATQQYAPFATLDVRLLWQKPKYSIYVDLKNLTDTQYVDYGGLAQPKFNFLAGVRVKI